MKLTIEHTELLYEIAEIHLDWIKKYNPDSKTTFEEMLKLNHGKLLNYFFDLEHTEKDITNKLLKMRWILKLSND